MLTSSLLLKLGLIGLIGAMLLLFHIHTKRGIYQIIYFTFMFLSSQRLVIIPQQDIMPFPKMILCVIILMLPSVIVRILSKYKAP